MSVGRRCVCDAPGAAQRSRLCTFFPDGQLPSPRPRAGPIAAVAEAVGRRAWKGPERRARARGEGQDGGAARGRPDGGGGWGSKVAMERIRGLSAFRDAGGVKGVGGRDGDCLSVSRGALIHCSRIGARAGCFGEGSQLSTSKAPRPRARERDTTRHRTEPPHEHTHRRALTHPRPSGDNHPLLCNVKTTTVARAHTRSTCGTRSLHRAPAPLETAPQTDARASKPAPRPHGQGFTPRARARSRPRGQPARPPNTRRRRRRVVAARRRPSARVCPRPTRKKP